MIQDEHLTDTSLPIERLGNINSKTLMGLVLSVVLTIVMINVAVAVIINKSHFDRGQVIVQKKWELLEGLQNPLDYILLGDSSPNQAFDPQIVREELGLNGVNLATIGTFGFVDDLWLLQAYLESFDAPKTVIIAHSFDVPQRDVAPLKLLGTYRIPLTSSITQNELSDFSYIQNVVTVYQRRIFPLHYRNETLIYMIEQFLKGQLDVLEVTYLIDDNGFMPWNEEGIIRVEDELAQIEQLIVSEQFPDEFSKINLQAIAYITELAQDYNFDLYFVNGTTYVGLEEVLPTVRSQLDQQYENIAKSHSNIHYISTPFTFPLEAMKSIDHIGADYAREYTQSLMRLIWSNP